MASKKKSVFFICLGNICRSPIAEAVFLNMLEEKGLSDQWDVDSGALGPWHVGKSPDKRALETMNKHGITNYKGRARQVCEGDFNRFDVIFGMDEDNMSELKCMRPKNSKAELKKLGEMDPEGQLIIRDPYYDDRKDTTGFEEVYVQCVRCCKAFLEKSS